MPDDLAQLVDGAIWHDLTDYGKVTLVAAWNHDSWMVTKKMDWIMQGDSPTGRMIWQCKRILAGPKRGTQKPKRRKAHDELDCVWCADTGFVVLSRDVSPDALKGDSAPCFCELGKTKMARYGVVTYTTQDIEPVVRDTKPISLVDYMNSPAGKADPYLPALLRLMRKEEGESASG